MSTSKKKAGSKKSVKRATPKTAPSVETKAFEKEPTSKPAAKVDGVEQARMRRLKRAGYNGADRCALLGIKLDAGPRSNRWHRPRRHGDGFVCELAIAIRESGVSPVQIAKFKGDL